MFRRVEGESLEPCGQCGIVHYCSNHDSSYNRGLGCSQIEQNNQTSLRLWEAKILDLLKQQEGQSEPTPASGLDFNDQVSESYQAAIYVTTDDLIPLMRHAAIEKAYEVVRNSWRFDWDVRPHGHHRDIYPVLALVLNQEDECLRGCLEVVHHGRWLNPLSQPPAIDFFDGLSTQFAGKADEDIWTWAALLLLRLKQYEELLSIQSHYTILNKSAGPSLPAEIQMLIASSTLASPPLTSTPRLLEPASLGRAIPLMNKQIRALHAMIEKHRACFFPRLMNATPRPERKYRVDCRGCSFHEPPQMALLANIWAQVPHACAFIEGHSRMEVARPWWMD